MADDLANGKNIIFCATGISDSALIARRENAGPHSDHSFNPDAGEKQTVRLIRATHDLQNKTIRLRSDNREHPI